MVHLRRLGYSFALLGFALPLAAQAEAKGSDMDELMALLNTPVESASKRAQKSTESPQAIQVLTGDQIRASGVFRLHDLLKLLTNVQIWEMDYETTRVAVRGVAPNLGVRTVQLLVDGVPLYNANALMIDVDNLPLPIDAIERVEVVRGPSSSLYGANAQLAVISITTKRAKEGVSGSLRLANNRHHTYRSEGFYAYGSKDFNLSVGVAGHSLQDSGLSWRAITTQRTVDPHDENHGNQLLLRAEFAVGEGKVWGLFGSGDKLGGLQTVETATGVKTSQFAHLRGSTDVTQVGWSQAWSSALRLELKLNQAHTVTGLGPISTVPGSPTSNVVVPLLLSVDPSLAFDYDVVTFTNQQVAFQVNWDPSATLHFVFGADTSRLIGGKSPVIGLKTERQDSATGGFVSMDWNLDALTLSLGARAENESLGGSRTSPRLALVYAFGDGSVLRTGYFTSSRSPQMTEAFGQLNVPGRPVQISNPELKPEEAGDFELGYRKTWAKWSLDLTLYQVKLKKFISSQPTGATQGGQPVVQFRNGSTDLTDKGVEATLTGELGAGWLLGLNAATVDFKDENVGGQGDYAPKYTANLWTRYKTGPFQAYVAVQRLDSYYQRNLANPGGARDKADPVTQFHFNIGMDFCKGFNASLYGINAHGAQPTAGAGVNNAHLIRLARRELGVQAAYRF